MKCNRSFRQDLMTSWRMAWAGRDMARCRRIEAVMARKYAPSTLQATLRDLERWAASEKTETVDIDMTIPKPFGQGPFQEFRDGLD